MVYIVSQFEDKTRIFGRTFGCATLADPENCTKVKQFWSGLEGLRPLDLPMEYLPNYSMSMTKDASLFCVASP